MERKLYSVNFCGGPLDGGWLAVELERQPHVYFDDVTETTYERAEGTLLNSLSIKFDYVENGFGHGLRGFFTSPANSQPPTQGPEIRTTIPEIRWQFRQVSGNPHGNSENPRASPQE